MKLFDYIYYRTYEFYRQFGETTPWIFGIGAMIISLYSLLITIDLLQTRLFNNDRIMVGLTGDLILIALIGVVFARYKWLTSIDEYRRRWDNELGSVGHFKGYLTIVYLLGTVTSMLYLTGFFNVI